jgi:transcriptional regulator with XRE-family HTH domain
MQTIGERLLEARQRRGVSVREAAEATKVRGDYLIAMESNQFDSIPLADVYKRGFLKIYARFLRLDSDRITGEYNGLLAARAPIGGKHRRITELNDGGSRPVEQREPESQDEFSSGAIEVAIRPDNRRKTILIGGAISLMTLIAIMLAFRGGESSPASTPAVAAMQEGEITLSCRNTVPMIVRLVRIADGKTAFEQTLKPRESVSIKALGKYELYANPLEKIHFSINGGITSAFPVGAVAYERGPIEVPAKTK